MVLESSSARGWTLFSATSVSTENVGSTMKSMKPAEEMSYVGEGLDEESASIAMPLAADGMHGK